MHKFLSKLYKVVGVEFGDISRNFEFLEIKTLHALNNSDPRANKAGVYIHYTDEHQVIKVGKHNTNARVRALQHIRDNTKNDVVQMYSLASNPEALIFFIVLTDTSKIHWVLALENYLEKHLNPTIRSKRSG